MEYIPKVCIDQLLHLLVEHHILGTPLIRLSYPKNYPQKRQRKHSVNHVSPLP